MTRETKPLLPAVVLIVATALSCSTACITYAAATAIGAAGAAATGLVATATRELESNRLRAVGNTALPVVTPDPASIAEALRPALPGTLAGGRRGADRVMVTTQTGGNGINIYTISAYGDFTAAYAQAFANFSNRLRTQLPGPNKFILLTYRDRWGTPTLVTRLEVD
jgi:hypothetical protein